MKQGNIHPIFYLKKVLEEKEIEDLDKEKSCQCHGHTSAVLALSKSTAKDSKNMEVNSETKES